MRKVVKSVKERKKLSKKGQLQLSFGMIFSIILIIAFLAFAFFGIKKFLGVQDQIKTEQFKSDFQNDITQMWKSYQGSQEVSYVLPRKIERVCLEDNEVTNLMFFPEGVYKDGNVEHVDFSKTLNGKNELCFYNSDGKVSMVIGKKLGENLVTITLK